MQIMRLFVFSFLFLVGSSCLAQTVKSVDIALKVVAPQNGGTYTPNTPLVFTLQARNISGATLESFDTIKIKFIYDGFIVPFRTPNGTMDTFLRIGGNQIAVGDSMIVFNQQIGIRDSGMHTLCFQSSLTTSATTGIVDPGIANNTGCTRINLTSLAVSSVEQKGSDFRLYPMPATGSLNWESEAFSPVAFAIYDLSGVCVQRSNVPANSRNIDITPLAGGVYQFIATDKSGGMVRRKIAVQ
ncbi:MAG: T9SS type A sorting domain-containing protein [Sphingobacteriales bacterium]|nr:MAG: T9SS type A sorting domain-containing protein [Sphingobacteriales bacterium]